MRLRGFLAGFLMLALFAGAGLQRLARAEGDAPAPADAPTDTPTEPANEAAPAGGGEQPGGQSENQPNEQQLQQGEGQSSGGQEPAQTEPEAPPAAPDPKFLTLPAYDVAVTPTGAIRVGDRIEMRVVGGATLSAPGAPNGSATPAPNASGGASGVPTAFQLVVPRGMDSEAPLDQGVDLSQAKGVAQDGDLIFPATVAKPGQLSMPSLAIQGADGVAVARTNPFTISVQSVIPPGDKNAQDSAPPRPPMRLGFPWIVLVLFGLLALAVVAGAIYGIIRLSRRSRGPAKPLPGPVVTPKTEDQVALEALADLERAGLLERAQFKKYYFQLSDLLKEYLGARYRVDAVEATTREMVALLTHTTIPPEALRELEGMFAKLDFVKFTDHVPAPTQGKELLEQARALVQRTKRPPPPVTPILREGTPRAL